MPPTKRAWEQREVEEGSLVVLMVKRGEVDFATVAAGKVLHNSLGKFAHDDIIGKSVGSVWSGESDNARAAKAPTLVPLPATPELWTRALSHRTQVLYNPDISLIVFHLDLKPGSVIVETGTGSGSLTYSLARTVAPNGHVFTFDFNSSRVELARKDFEALGIAEVCTSALADASSEQGFGLQRVADAVFLDLPKPWLAVNNAIKALKAHECTRIASFSPCIEQVSRMCETLTEAGFVQIRTFECVNRELESYVYGFGHEPPPPLWDGDSIPSPQQTRTRPTFAPREDAGTCYAPKMNSHSGYLTFASLYPKQ